MFESGFADVVTGFLAEHDFADAGFDGAIVGGAAERVFEVVFDEAEEAGADLAVGGDPNTIAVAAEGFGDGGDDPDFGGGIGGEIGEAPASGGFGGIGGVAGEEFEAGTNSGEHFATGDDELAEPGAAGVEGHEFDEAEGELMLMGELGEGGEFVVVEVAEDDGVDLDGGEAEFGGQLDGVEDGPAAVASG